MTAVVLGACSGDGGDALETRALATPVAEGSGQAHLALDVDGSPVLSWLEPADVGFALRYSLLRDGAWTAPADVASGDDLMVNWADFPSVTPIDDEVWVAHWLVLKPDAFGAYDIAFALSHDSGATWSSSTKLNLDDTNTEHGFVTVFAWDGDIGMVWLDGRALADWSFDEPDALLGTSLRYVRMARDGTVSERGVVDEIVCDCCNTDVVVADDGPVVVYRDRTPEELRDVVARRHDGQAWTEPAALGAERWHIEGCPVNGPAVASRGNDVVAAWFTAADGQGSVRLARSEDGGRRFAAPVEIDPDAFGQVDVVLRRDGSAVVSWWRPRDGGGIALAARSVDANGDVGAIHRIAASDVAQPVDVPQMIETSSGMLFAWTTLDDPGTVHTALVTGLD